MQVLSGTLQRDSLLRIGVIEIAVTGFSDFISQSILVCMNG